MMESLLTLQDVNVLKIGGKQILSSTVNDFKTLLHLVGPWMYHYFYHVSVHGRFHGNEIPGKYRIRSDDDVGSREQQP